VDFVTSSPDILEFFNDTVDSIHECPSEFTQERFSKILKKCNMIGPFTDTVVEDKISLLNNAKGLNTCYFPDFLNPQMTPGLSSLVYRSSDVSLIKTAASSHQIKHLKITNYCYQFKLERNAKYLVNSVTSITFQLYNSRSHYDLSNLVYYRNLRILKRFGIRKNTSVYRLPVKISGNISYMDLSRISIIEDLLEIDVPVIYLKFAEGKAHSKLLKKITFSGNVEKITLFQVHPDVEELNAFLQRIAIADNHSNQVVIDVISSYDYLLELKLDLEGYRKQMFKRIRFTRVGKKNS
jgi:hypothetical protein